MVAAISKLPSTLQPVPPLMLEHSAKQAVRERNSGPGDRRSQSPSNRVCCSYYRLLRLSKVQRAPSENVETIAGIAVSSILATICAGATIAWGGMPKRFLPPREPLAVAKVHTRAQHVRRTNSRPRRLALLLGELFDRSA
jgi:hypothetical protein